MWSDTVSTIKIPKELMMVSRTYDPSTGYLLLTIYTYYEEFEQAMPASERILAEQLDMGSSTLRRSLKRLKDEGFIEISSAGGNRKVKPNFNYPWKFWEQLQDTWKIINGEKVVFNTREFDPIVVEAIEYWNSKVGLNPVAIPLNHGNNYYEITEQFSKLEGRMKSLLSGKLFNSIKSLRFWHSKPWSLEEIKVSIDNFHLAATDESYSPYIKTTFKKLRMIEFLSCPFIKSCPEPIITFQDKPKFAQIKSEEIKHPGLYFSLKEEMVQIFTKGRELRSLEDMKIVVASNRIGELIQTDYKRYLQTNLTSTMWAGYIVEALLTILRRDDKNFSVFSTVLQPWFLDRAFPQFLMKKGILSEYPLK